MAKVKNGNAALFTRRSWEYMNAQAVILSRAGWSEAVVGEAFIHRPQPFAYPADHAEYVFIPNEFGTKLGLNGARNRGFRELLKEKINELGSDEQANQDGGGTDES